MTLLSFPLCTARLYDIKSRFFFFFFFGLETIRFWSIRRVRVVRLTDSNLRFPVNNSLESSSVVSKRGRLRRSTDDDNQRVRGNNSRLSSGFLSRAPPLYYQLYKRRDDWDNHS